VRVSGSVELSVLQVALQMDRYTIILLSMTLLLHVSLFLWHYIYFIMELIFG